MIATQKRLVNYFDDSKVFQFKFLLCYSFPDIKNVHQKISKEKKDVIFFFCRYLNVCECLARQQKQKRCCEKVETGMVDVIVSSKMSLYLYLSQFVKPYKTVCPNQLDTIDKYMSSCNDA